MKDEDMDAWLNELKVQVIAHSSTAGDALESRGSFDVDTLCAVVSVAADQLRGVAEVLGAGRLERWHLVTERQTYYVSERADGRWLAVGEAVKNAEVTAKALHRLAR